MIEGPLLFCYYQASLIAPRPNKYQLTMENSQPLSIESFSYSWLVNLKPSLDDESVTGASIDASDEASNSFIEMDPKLTPSKRFFRGSSHDFNFDFPTSQSPLTTLVHADELISNGFVLPLFLKQLKMEAYNSSASNSSIPTTPIPISSTNSQKNVHSASKLRCSSLRRCRRLSKRLFFNKYLDFLWPLCRKFRSGSSRVETVDSTMEEDNQWIAVSPRTSVAYSADNWRRSSCDSESSIYEAVLHCKRSIGK